MISKRLKPATCLYGTEAKPLNKKQTNKQSGVYLHDASYQYTEDVGLEQRSPQTHSASTFLLSMLLYFLSLFRFFSSAATFSPSSWVLLSRFTVSTFLISAPPFLLSAYTVHGMAHVDQAGSGHKHNLEHLRKYKCKVSKLKNTSMWHHIGHVVKPLWGTGSCFF